LQREHEPAVAALFRNAAVARLADAGHWVHADAPEAFLALVEQFLTTRIFSNAD
jgi:esterase